MLARGARVKKKKAARKITKKKSRKSPRKSAARKKAKAAKPKRLAIEFRTTKRLPPEEVKKLFRAAGWTGDLARYSAKKVRLKLNRSHLVVTAWQEKQLVGFASAISDGVLCALVDNLIVHPGLRGNGLGGSLMRRLGKELRAQGVEYIFGLGTRSKKSNKFFEGAGFQQIPWRVFLRSPR